MTIYLSLERVMRDTMFMIQASVTYPGPVHSGKKNEYGQGKHSKGGKPKQKHW